MPALRSTRAQVPPPNYGLDVSNPSDIPMEEPEEQAASEQQEMEEEPENMDDDGTTEQTVGKGRGKRKKGQGKQEVEEDPIVPPPQKKPRRCGKGRGRQAPVEDGASLFDIVKGGRSALRSVIDDWIERYKQDRDPALLELMQFFIRSSGCKGFITSEMQEQLQHAQIIRRMTEEFDEDSGDYPLIMGGPQWKKFRNNYCEFVAVLVRQCQYSIIYDQYLMDNVISLLTGLSDSQVRAFRHTSTLAVMKLMTALVDVALNLSVNKDFTQRQYEAERQKNQSKRATERLELLMQKRKELEEQTEEIRNMLTYMFKSVFVHRYRDTLPDIRSICMGEIGIWMKKYPNMFLDDGYLKYIGWTLHDKVGDVRLKCLQSLLPLYQTEELGPKMELFTNKFKDRIVSMTLDKEYDVAVQGVKLVIAIQKNHKDILSDKDCEHVYELVYSSHRQVAQAAGEFLNEKLFTLDDDMEPAKTKRGKKRSINTPLIRDLVQFFIESELHEHGAYLVDSLIDNHPMMKDWECMTDLLLEESGKGEEQLEDRYETSLIEILCCCVRQAATGEPPVGRGPNRKLSTKEQKQIIDDKVKLTEHFIQTLPPLLSKYIQDPEKIANLMSIPQYFELEIYTTSRQEKSLELLLKLVHEVVLRHTDGEVLEACAKTVELLCGNEYAIRGKCEVARATLLDQLMEKFREAYQTFIEEGEDADEDEEFALMSSMKRITSFSSCHDMTAYNLWDALMALIKAASEDKHLPEAILCKSINCCSYVLMWSLGNLDNHNPDKPAMKQLKRNLNEFMSLLRTLMMSAQDAVEEEAFLTICDLLIIFSKQLMHTAVLAALTYEPDKNLQGQLGGFIDEKVFVEDEDEDQDEHQKIEELHKRRNFLASFCKLVVYNIVSIRTAADVFKHYCRFYNDYGDIIKSALGKSREINKVTCARTLAVSLTSVFKEVQAEQGGRVNRGSEGFSALKELGRRFSMSFGLDLVRNRVAIASLHREGIIFALSPLENPDDPRGPPPNIAFLDLMCEFSNKLMKQDKKTVLQYLEKHMSKAPHLIRGEEWSPYVTYKNSLLHHGSHASEFEPTVQKHREPKEHKPRRVRGKRKAELDFGDVDAQPAQATRQSKRGRVTQQQQLEEEESEQGSEREFET
ncbi:PREDICTED: cohesin subunit SA-1-like isoform X2 [Priapulus caudatus]|uniref:Cohesin subunit SA-1-like isoform X2 n=1 Tax=Priapulus caudatus TaxID=37621 RepID=A0ABM1E7A5_PRICU|nr:PREDICTED: cohesin subunit SA-1-like isoform X2 [Priapulus caudatus]